AAAGCEDELEGLPDGVAVRRRAAGRADVVVAFTTEVRDLSRRFRPLAKSVWPDGSFWVAWPKRSSGVTTDLDENPLREIGLPHGLVDNKVCAVDETWSGLRFVWRKENRKDRPA